MPRRVFLTLCAPVLFEGLLFTALGPLLPELKEDLGLSAAQVGLLASAYVVGALLATLPAAVSTARLGVKATVVFGLLVVAGMSFAFGVAGSYPALLGVQLLAGVGAGAMWVAAMSWLIEVAPPGRRGELIGAAFSVTAVGDIAGPIVGGVAATVGRAVTFGAIATAALLFAGLILRIAAPAGGQLELDFRAVVGSTRARVAAGLTAVPNFMLGALIVLGTLQLNRLGAGPAAIAAVLVLAAGAAVVQGPLVGRWSDRSGRLRPIRFGLISGIPTVLGLAWAENRVVVGALVIAAIVTVRFSMGPTVAMLSDACDDAGVGAALTFLIVLPVSAAAIAIGTAGGGVLTQAAGLPGAYVAVAAVLLAVLVGIRGQTDAGHV